MLKKISAFLSRPMSSVPRQQRIVLRVSRLLSSLGRDLARGEINLHAMSLVYTTLLSLVPLLAFSFSLLKGFGVHNQLEPMLHGLLAPLGDKSAEITAQVIQFVENVKVGVLGAVGLGALLYTVYSLMHKVTLAIDLTWNLRRGQSLTKRLGTYFSMLLLGPFLLFALAGALTGFVESAFAQSLLSVALVGKVYEHLLNWMPFVVIAGVLSLTYILVPAARVRWWAAVSGGIAASLMWKLLGLAFGAFVVTSTKYTAIYSAFATLMLLLIWLHFSWLTYLLGSRIAFYLQNPESARPESDPDAPQPAELTSLRILREVVRGYYQDQGGLSAAQLRRRLDVPAATLEQSVEKLERIGLVVTTATTEPAYLPARPPEQVKLSEVISQLFGLSDLENLDMLPDDLLKVFASIESGIQSNLSRQTLYSAFVEEAGVFVDKGLNDDLSLN